ncbi:hypothetical protein Bbelb_445900 [Branchiostoma belcheri]|nr:hypothetical protein Bbelb_445900 [Branchiostoma belcheri]
MDGDEGRGTCTALPKMAPPPPQITGRTIVIFVGRAYAIRGGSFPCGGSDVAARVVMHDWQKNGNAQHHFVRQVSGLNNSSNGCEEVPNTIHDLELKGSRRWCWVEGCGQKMHGCFLLRLTCAAVVVNEKSCQAGKKCGPFGPK